MLYSFHTFLRRSDKNGTGRSRESMQKKSIYSRFTPAVIISVILLVVFTNLACFTILLQDEKRNAGTAADLNQFFVSETDKSLKAIEEYTYLLRCNESAFDSLHASGDWEQVSAGQSIKNLLNRTVNAFPLLEYICVYDTISGRYLYSFNGESTALMRAGMKQYLMDLLQEKNDPDTHWNAVTVSDESFLLRISHEKNTYTGTWIRMSDFEKPLQKLRHDTAILPIVTDDALEPKSQQSFLKENGIELRTDSDFYTAGEWNRYYVRTDRSEAAPYCLCLVIPRNVLSGIGSFFVVTLIFVSVLSVALIPLLFRLIRKDVTEPLKALDTAIYEIKGGNHLYQIPPRDDPEEFVRVDEAFNTMTRQLNEAKIQSYEDVIEKQKLRLSYLQMQIRPHFFMNALTTVSNFARLGKQEELDRFISYLAAYLRYMFRSNLTLVPLGEEIAHIETFLSMQELRFSGTLSHVFDIPEQALCVMLPPFTIQNFAENVIKHAMSEQKHVTLYLQVQTRDDGILITVEDNGAGIPEDALEQMNDSCYTPKAGQSIGIWNTRQTLRLIYKDRASVSISNSLLGGAKVELMIPYECEERMVTGTDEDPVV